MAFTTLISTDRDFGSPINEDVITQLHDRDEDLRESVVYLEVAEFTQNQTTYIAIDKSWQIYIPQGADQLYVAFQYYTVNITSGEAQCKIGALTSSEVTGAKAAYSTAPSVVWCNFSDLSTVVGTEVQLDLYAKITTPTGGSPRIHVQEANGPASYFTG